MKRFSLSLVAAVACLATAPLGGTAQQPQKPAQHVTQPHETAGPRLPAGFKSFRPKLEQEEAATTASTAAASTTTITISTLGLVLIAVLLILLLT